MMYIHIINQRDKYFTVIMFLIVMSLVLCTTIKTWPDFRIDGDDEHR